jgi:hypothetical protein
MTPAFPLRTDFLFDFSVKVGDPLDLGNTPFGGRRIFSIGGGDFEGPRLRGAVLPGGGDWLLFRGDGVMQLDVRATLRTDDGELIDMRYAGMRHGEQSVLDRITRGETVSADEYYFRVTVSFETGSERYAWLNKLLAVGVGHRLPSGPRYSVHQVL